jgi:hypothetical protein
MHAISAGAVRLGESYLSSFPPNSKGLSPHGLYLPNQWLDFQVFFGARLRYLWGTPDTHGVGLGLVPIWGI